MKTLVSLATFATFATFIPALASAAPRARLVLDPPRAAAQLPTGALCTGVEARCHVHAVVTPDGEVVATVAPKGGYGADDLQAAYAIDPTVSSTATIAIVDAYAYPTLEKDLAVYRKQYGLPACTVASGCLTIVNQAGARSPLPKASPSNDDWTPEQALDVAMASVSCPSCKLVVVQTDDDTNQNLFDGMLAALQLGASVVSNSFGLQENALDAVKADGLLAQYPGIALFASTGDSGYDTGGTGPQYPSTSTHAIAVGGTVLTTASNARGWSETAWPMAGSSCSLQLPALATQTTTACALRAAADLSAIAGDPGVAVYNKGAWLQLEGTSASTPLVAGMFAALGATAVTPDDIVSLTGALTDVTSGSNGTCKTALCKAGVGWDGPTGYGSPSFTRLAEAVGGGGSGSGGGSESATVTSPQAGAVVAPGFVIALQVTGALTIAASIDGTSIGTASAPPYEIATPTDLANGSHEIEIVATDPAGQSGSTTVDVDVEGTAAPATGSSAGSAGSAAAPSVGGCAAGSTGAGAGYALLVIGFGIALLRRRRPA